MNSFFKVPSENWDINKKFSFHLNITVLKVDYKALLPHQETERTDLGETGRGWATTFLGCCEQPKIHL